MKYYYFSIATGFFLLCISYVCRLPHSTMNISKDTKTNIVSLLPQGWAFFTRSPKEEKILVYKVHPSGLKKISMSNPDEKNLFGISRLSRRLTMETSIVLHEAKKISWTEKTGVEHPPINSLEPLHIQSTNNIIRNIQSGQYLIYKEKPIPWAWKKNFNKANTSRKYVLVDYVKCKTT